ncbi:translation initiation factor eIF-2B epsilon subunit [Histoplasma capsulatum var. duboisii H88]|uniref:Mannose-1-phosphate guanyltransferase n=1 Tax=Ajellomyces capsulatus (strain H88) TaxID=544711 RepID=F0U7T0_AJEC8|nr:translation initiation factor eIF-2B epsilon subunit [Histoplasma capsulatum var. duboisii H88]QSS51150.1 translation initiation factor eIF-2B epsilon subunit [Histoplasma capsulatum var. duboisii H88]
MGSKSKSGGGAGGRQKSQAAEDEREEPLQAVVLADTFETRFEPFTLEKPRCLLPLANIPIIEYTLEFLANAGVEEVFLYGGAHADQVEIYINASKWKSPSSPFKSFIFLKSTSTSVGDVMRDLDGKHLITRDFIIVSGDVVSNYAIEEALAKHRERRQTDKNAIMTMILRETNVSHRSNPSIAPVFFIDPTKDRCLHYEEIESRPRRKSNSSSHPRSSNYLSVDPDMLKEFSEIDIRSDLVDTYIDICTPDVLSLWSDSFDYQTPRKQFLYGVLKDYELSGKTIHTHIIKDHYAARVRNLKTYDSISKDIVSRYTYPLCLETNLVPGNTYSLKRRNIYEEQGVRYAPSCDIGPKTVIGRGTILGDHTAVTNTVIGRRCRIGKNVVLEGAYLWDDVVVGDGTEIHHAIVANNVVVADNCRIENGALLSYGVKIANGTTIHEGMKITRAEREQGFVPSDPKIVGEGGIGYEFSHQEDEDDESDDESVASSGLLYNISGLSLSTDSISTLSSELSDDDFSPLHRVDSLGPSLDDDADRSHFHHDAVNSVYDGLCDGLSADVVQLELVGLRMSANASEHQVRHAVVTAFIKRIQGLMDAPSPLSASDAVKQVLGKYKDILDRIVFDRDEPARKPDQVDLLLLIQQELVEKSRGETVLLFMAKELYDLETVEEEAFEQWWADERAVANEGLKKVRRQTEPFIEWLANADSEEDEEEEEEEEGSEGEED